ncbi:MAG: HAD family phosphatase [Bacteroidales bacterium]
MADMSFAFIFDLDGVVIHSNPLHRLAWQSFLQDRGIELTDRLFSEVIAGKTGDASLQSLFDGGLSAGEIDASLNAIDAEYRNILRKSNAFPAVPGVIPFLNECRDLGLVTALATSAPPENVSLSLELLHLESEFRVVLDKTHVSRGKPHPEVYLKTLSILGLDPFDAVVFEDSKAGIRAARAAGIPVVGIATGHTPDELRKEGAFLTAADFRALRPADVLRESRSQRP